jgi:hypothetical protein
MNCRLLKDKVLLSDNVFPDSCAKENKMIQILGDEYISYHTCLNDFIPYRNEYVDREIFPKCGHARYHK